MRYAPLPFSDPPEALKKVRLNNIALVPVSLLPLTGTYQTLANRLPTGSMLCAPETLRQQKIIAQVEQFFRGHGQSIFP